MHGGYINITGTVSTRHNQYPSPALHGYVPRKPYSTVTLPQSDLDAAQRALQRASELEGISYASLAEFVRDALRRRIEEINEAYRDAHAVRDRMDLPERAGRRRTNPSDFPMRSSRIFRALSVRTLWIRSTMSFRMCFASRPFFSTISCTTSSASSKPHAIRDPQIPLRHPDDLHRGSVDGWI
jgi:hypothetical protein